MAGTQPNALREAPVFRSVIPCGSCPLCAQPFGLSVDLIQEFRMAHGDKSTQAVTLEELAVSNAFEVAGLIGVLERKGFLTPAEVLDEIARQKKVRSRGR